MSQSERESEEGMFKRKSWNFVGSPKKRGSSPDSGWDELFRYAAELASCFASSYGEKLSSSSYLQPQRSLGRFEAGRVTNIYRTPLATAGFAGSLTWMRFRRGGVVETREPVDVHESPGNWMQKQQAFFFM